MADKAGQGQADKRAAEERTAQVAKDRQAEQEERERQGAAEPRSAAEKSTTAPAEEVAVNPYPNYDLMTLDQLRELAAERGVEINRDVEKAHLVTELRAADTHTG